MASNRIDHQTVTIANGASLSDAAELAGLLLVAIVMPAAWTAANLTFQGSTNGTDYFDVYDKTGSEVTVTAAASRYIILNPADFAGLEYVKIRSGTTAAAVNQGAERTITVQQRTAD